MSDMTFCQYTRPLPPQCRCLVAESGARTCSPDEPVKLECASRRVHHYSFCTSDHVRIWQEFEICVGLHPKCFQTCFPPRLHQTVCWLSLSEAARGFKFHGCIWKGRSLTRRWQTEWSGAYSTLTRQTTWTLPHQ